MARSAAAAEMPTGERLTSNTLSIMNQVFQQMALLPVSRTLVLISSGFNTMTTKARGWQADAIQRGAQAGVTVNALDARGLYTSMPDARHGVESAGEEQYRNNSSRAYGSALQEIASGTAGSYLHDSNDFKGGLEVPMKPAEVLYLLAFSPEGTKQDGSFHNIKVKVGRKGLTVKARSGYIAGTATSR